MQHIEAAVLLGLEVVYEDLRDADHPDTGGGLWALGFVLGEIITLTDCDGGVLQIHVGPGEGSGFAPAEAGVEQEHHCLEKLAGLHCKDSFWILGVIKALLRGKVCLAGQTKLPENWLGKPTFGEFDVELLIRFERTTCSLRVSCSTG